MGWVVEGEGKENLNAKKPITMTSQLHTSCVKNSIE